MTANVVNQVAFLRTTRQFPDDLKQLTVEVNRSYVDVANSVNARIIGIYPTNRPAITGESWFLSGNQRQQTSRQVYTFTSTSDINIGFKLSSINQISPKTCGVYTDGTRFFGLIFGTSVAIAGQISFYLDVNGASTTSDIIKFVSGAGAPALTSGVIDIEWLSAP